MNSKNVRIKKVLLFAILGVLLLPLVQEQIAFYSSKPLMGYSVPAEKKEYSSENWLNGEFQQAYEKWHSENFGFREEIVRLYNQLGFCLYNDAKANGVIIGNDGYLYEIDYITTYTGEDFVGESELRTTAEKIKALQDSFAANNVTLIICLAAGKASFYPEYIPHDYGKASDSTNYKIFAKLLKEYHINHIDYNRWFMEMKGKSEYLLYPRTGIHWSNYGSILAIDSLIRYVEYKRNIDMANLVIDSVVVSDTIRDPDDDDIGKAMNLLWPIKPLPMAYPQYHWEDAAGKVQPSMMGLGDSFFWSVYNSGAGTASFRSLSYYYYNKEIYRAGWEGSETASATIGLSDAMQHDVIVIMATEANIPEIGWGFIDEAFNQFVLHKMVMKIDVLVEKYATGIRNDKEWLSAVRSKAIEKGIPVDSMLYLDAKFMADEELKKLGNH